MRLAILTSHPVQYYAPLFRELARQIDLHVFFAHEPTAEQQGAAGFEGAFTWDVDLKSGYPHSFLRNVASQPNASRFSGCDTPEIGDRLREGGFDVVLALGWHLKSLQQGIRAAKRLRLPVMIRGDSQLGMQGSAVKRIVKEVAYPVLLRVFDAALFVGQRNHAYYRHYRYPERRLFHAPHAIDTGWFAARAGADARAAKRAELGLADGDRAVLFAGKLLPFKRPLDAVDAVAAMATPARLMIAGSGPLRDALTVRAAERSVEVIDLGFLNQTAMPAAYAAADALLLPSTGRETWGLVCNEALACGTPVVISSDAGSAPDLGIDGRAGRTYVGGNPVDAARALDALFADPPRADEIAALSNRFGLRSAAAGIIQAARTLCP